MPTLECKSMKDTQLFFEYNSSKTIAKFSKIKSKEDSKERMERLKLFVDKVNTKAKKYEPTKNYKLTLVDANLKDKKISKVKITPTTMTIPGLVRTLCKDFDDPIKMTVPKISKTPRPEGCPPCP